MADSVSIEVLNQPQVIIEIPIGAPGPPGADGQAQLAAHEAAYHSPITAPIDLPITSGQTVWTVPAGLNSNRLLVSWSGIAQRNGIDWTLSGTTFTWIGPTLQTYHSLEIFLL